jgi:hypothetical protein
MLDSKSGHDHSRAHPIGIFIHQSRYLSTLFMVWDADSIEKSSTKTKEEIKQIDKRVRMKENKQEKGGGEWGSQNISVTKAVKGLPPSSG